MRSLREVFWLVVLGILVALTIITILVVFANERYINRGSVEHQESSDRATE